MPIYVHPDYDDGRSVSLELKGLTLREVLAWIGHQTWTHVVVEDGMVRFAEEPPTDVRIHEIADLVRAPSEDGESYEEYLVELIHSSIGWEAWDIEPARTIVWDGMLIVEQTPAAHAGIAAFLDALREALKD